MSSPGKGDAVEPMSSEPSPERNRDVQRLRKLKPGPGLPAAVVSADQKRRLRAAMIELVAERGHERVRVRELSNRAAVSTRSFYRHFQNVADCLGYAGESMVVSAVERMEEASTSAVQPEDRVRLAMGSLMGEIAADSMAASLLLIDISAGGRPLQMRMKAPIGSLRRAFVDPLTILSEGRRISADLLDALIAGVLRVATTTARLGRIQELTSMSPTLAEWMIALAPTVSRRTSKRQTAGHNRSRGIHAIASLERQLLGGSREVDSRQRIFRATLKIAARDGFANISVPAVRRAAGVSRRQFDVYFPSLSACFLDSLEWLARGAVTQAVASTDQRAPFHQRIREMMGFLATQAFSNRSLAGLVLVGILDAGRDGLLRREELITKATRQIQLEGARAADWSISASIAAAWHLGAVHTTGQIDQPGQGAPSTLADLVAAGALWRCPPKR